MKVVKWARLLPALLLVVAPFLDGCGNFWQAPGGSSGGGTTTTTLSSGVFYVLNQTTRQIVAYQISSGTLNTVGTYTLTAAPYALAIGPANAYLYVATVAGIYLYTIGSTGALTLGNSGQAISTDIAQAIAIDTTHTWLVDAVTGTSGVIVNAISITSSGTLNSTSEETQSFSDTGTLVDSVQKMAISGDDAFVFVSLGTGGTLLIPFNSANTNPLSNAGTTIKTVTTGASSLSVAVDPGTSPRTFYVGETEASSGSGGLRAFDYTALTNGTVTELSGSPYATGGTAPAAILTDNTDTYVYVASGKGTTSDGLIQGFTINTSTSASATSYSLAALNGTANTGIGPLGLAEDSMSDFVLAVSSGGSYDLEAYIFDTTTAGQLDTTITSTTGTDPTGAWAVAAQTP